MPKLANAELADTELANTDPVLSDPASFSDASRYEQACDEAIAMCDGNMRSTIKALIMANEYLEAELQDLQAATSRKGTTSQLHRTRDDEA